MRAPAPPPHASAPPDSQHRCRSAVTPARIRAVGLAVVAVYTAALLWLVRSRGDELDGVLVLQPALLVLVLVIGIVSSAHLIEARLEAEQAADREREHVRLLLEDFEGGTRDWLWQTDRRGRLTHVSPRLAEVSGLASDDLEGLSLVSLLTRLRSEDGDDGLDRLISALSDRRAFRDLEVAVTVGRSRRIWSFSGAPQLGPGPRLDGWRGVGADVTDARQQQEEIVRLATRDTVTGVANRHRFTRDLAAAVADITPGDEVWLALLDLDDFKAVNDTRGHPVGDLLLEAFARRLDARFPDGLCARLGGDEFAVCLIRPAGQDEEVRRAFARALHALSEPYRIGGAMLSVGASAGLAVSPRDADDVESLFIAADLALYEAKRDRRGRLAQFTSALRERAVALTELRNDLREAVADGQLRLVYQPVVSCLTGHVEAVEALLRWDHPTRGTVEPDEFIPAAEEAGLMPDIGLEVVRQACVDLPHLPPDVRMAVNVSPLQLVSPGFDQAVLDLLATRDIDPSRLTVEITETSLVERAAVERLTRLRESGIRIAIDDFGTGYSSFAALGGLPLDVLKIDRSLIVPLAGSRPDDAPRAVVRAMVDVARALGLETVAEGVETEADRQAVTDLGCTAYQGFLDTHPVPLPDVLAFLRAGPRRPMSPSSVISPT